MKTTLYAGPQDALNSGESFGAGSSPKSALEMEDILEHLFSFLSVTDLCNVRQVCTLWNHEAIPHLRNSSGPIILTRKEQMESLLLCVQQSCAGFPFYNFHLDMVKWKNEFPVEIWKPLMNHAAPWLTSLRVSSQHKPDSPLLALSPEKTFPSLKKINIFDHIGYDTADQTSFCVQIVKNAPNLSTLNLCYFNIKTSLLRQLSQVKSLRLKAFSLKYWFFEGEPEFSPSVFGFLESQRHSLQTLSLESTGRHQLKSPNLIFPALENLSLCWYDFKFGNIFEDAVQYAEAFPQLRYLRLHGKLITDPNLKNWEPVLWRQKPAYSVTKLALVGLEDPASQQLFRENSSNLFLNLTSLEIQESDGIVWSIPELMNAFGKLHELNLHIKRPTGLAMALTGEPQLTEEIVEKWNRKMEIESCSALKRLRLFKLLFTIQYSAQILEGHCLSELQCRLLRILLPNLEILHLMWTQEMRGPRPLTQWMAELERDTVIIFN